MHPQKGITNQYETVVGVSMRRETGRVIGVNDVKDARRRSSSEEELLSQPSWEED